MSQIDDLRSILAIIEYVEIDIRNDDISYDQMCSQSLPKLKKAKELIWKHIENLNPSLNNDYRKARRFK